MIEVKRFDYKQKVFTYKNGKQKTTPAYYECFYRFERKEIACYDSRTDTLYLNSLYISKDRKLKEYDRALAWELKSAYKYLFEMLGVDKDSKLSEYANI